MGKLIQWIRGRHKYQSVLNSVIIYKCVKIHVSTEFQMSTVQSLLLESDSMTSSLQSSIKK